MTYDTKSSGNVIKRHEINDLSPETCYRANFLAPYRLLQVHRIAQPCFDISSKLGHCVTTGIDMFLFVFNLFFQNISTFIVGILCFI